MKNKNDAQLSFTFYLYTSLRRKHSLAFHATYKVSSRGKVPKLLCQLSFYPIIRTNLLTMQGSCDSITVYKMEFNINCQVDSDRPSFNHATV